ncbi:MAG: hypothetical protein II243_05835 [Lachnospiraceae bacterium]|nr:hypothetical protein [Lachnospiraceae bacterium]
MYSFKNNCDFNKLEPRKQHAIENLVNSLNKKNIQEAFTLFLSWKNQLEKEHIVFSAEENALLNEIFINELSPEQKSQYELLKNLIKK